MQHFFEWFVRLVTRNVRSCESYNNKLELQEIWHKRQLEKVPVNSDINFIPIYIHAEDRKSYKHNVFLDVQKHTASIQCFWSSFWNAIPRPIIFCNFPPTELTEQRFMSSHPRANATQILGRIQILWPALNLN